MSTTDQESGLFHKDEHKKVFAYTANDSNNFIFDFVLKSGNKYYSTEFPKLYERLVNRYNDIKCSS